VYCNCRIFMLPIYSSAVTPYTLNIYRITTFLKSLLSRFSVGKCGTGKCLQDSVIFVAHLSEGFLHTIS